MSDASDDTVTDPRRRSSRTSTESYRKRLSNENEEERRAASEAKRRKPPKKAKSTVFSSSSSSSEEDNNERPDEERQQRRYKYTDLDNITTVYLRFSFHNAKSKADPKFTAPFNIQGKTEIGVSLSIDSQIDQVTDVINTVFASEKKELCSHKTSNVKLHCRAKPQHEVLIEGSSFKTRKTEDVSTIVNTDQWQQALLNISRKELDYSNLDGNEDSSNDSDVKSLHLDLICVLSDKKTPQPGATSGTGKRKALEDHEIKVALMLLGPAEKDETVDPPVYTVADKSDATYIETLQPDPDRDSERVSWTQVCHAAVKAGRSDDRHSGAIGK